MVRQKNRFIHTKCDDPKSKLLCKSCDHKKDQQNIDHSRKRQCQKRITTVSSRPDIRFTTWEDFAIMAMAEKGLGIGILPDMILRRIPYKLEIRSLEVPYYREIGLAMKNRNRLTPATLKFIEYLN